MAAPENNDKQKELLVNLLELNEDLGFFKALKDNETNSMRRGRWDELSSMLNSEGPIQKTGKQWQEYWRQ